MMLVTLVLVLGIRESARTNATLVIIKVFVVLFVVAVGWAYVQPANWTGIPVTQRVLPEEQGLAEDSCKELGADPPPKRVDQLAKQLAAAYRVAWATKEAARLHAAGRLSDAEAVAMTAEVAERRWPQPSADGAKIARSSTGFCRRFTKHGRGRRLESWGILGWLGLNRWLLPIDDATRSPFMPYGLSGIMLGASIVFFAYHRLRFDLHPRRRSPPAAARRADRHHHLAGVFAPCSTWRWRR